MPGRSHRGPFSPLTPQEAEVSARLVGHVQTLAGRIGERNAFHADGLRKAAGHVEGSFAEMAEAVAPQEFAVLAGQTVANLEVERRGLDRPQEIVVVGAHYDSVPGSPGANDNATGVASLIEIARLLRPSRLRRTVRFAAFVNEEPPYFQSEFMGSLVHARGCRARGEEITAMLALETMGYYRDEPGTQHYPAPLGLIYPSEGNFIGFVGDTGSRALVKECVRVFRETTRFPSEGGATFSAIPGVGWSDHWSFWQAGYPGIMVTDTAPYRYPEYHSADDKPERVDYGRLARVAAGIARVVRHLAGAEPGARAAGGEG